MLFRMVPKLDEAGAPHGHGFSAMLFRMVPKQKILIERSTKQF